MGRNRKPAKAISLFPNQEPFESRPFKGVDLYEEKIERAATVAAAKVYDQMNDLRTAKKSPDYQKKVAQTIKSIKKALPLLKRAATIFALFPVNENNDVTTDTPTGDTEYVDANMVMFELRMYLRKLQLKTTQA